MIRGLIFTIISFWVLKCNAQTQAYTSEQKKVFSLDSAVQDKTTDVLDANALHTLPIGITKNIGATRYVIAIDSAIFKPNGAYFSAYMAIVFPGSNKRIAFGAKNIKFNPSGVSGGEQSRLVLISNHSLQITENLKLNLKADGSNFIEWNCEGFQAVHLKGEFEFSSSRMKPANPGDSTVKATFEIHTNDIHNFITSVSITPFTLQGLEDWKFSVTNAAVDMSELANHPSQVFPNGYQMELPSSPQLWTGFFLQNLQITLPPELSKHDQPTVIQASNILIDKTGFTGAISVQNIFSTQEGNADGWGFSLDELGVSFISNKLSSGTMKGKMKIPAMGENGLQYQAVVSWHPVTKETNYLFSISPAENLSFDAFSAKVDLYSTSTIIVQKINGKFKPKVILNGKISLEHQNASTPKLGFQNLTFTTEAPYLTNGQFEYTGDPNDQNSKVAKFNISISNFGLDISNSKPKIKFRAMINFMDQQDNPFSASSEIKFGANVNMQNGQHQWSFDKVYIGDINLQVATNSFYLAGMIKFLDDDPVFGDGFAGKIIFQIYGIMPDAVEVNAQFGFTTFRYYYIDAFIPVNIPLGTVNITRLMGGMYYHMRPAYYSNSQFYANITQTPTANEHKTKYVPDNSISRAFKAGVSYQFNKSEKALNGDALFEIAFSSAGGLDFIRFDGKAYMLATVQERRTKSAPASGSVLIQYDNINKIFDATLTCNFNTYGFSGNAYSKIHIEPEIWFVCVGKPTIPANVNVPVIGNVNAYLMVGNQLEPMAAPPAQVMAIVNANGMQIQRNAEALANASGFVCGARMGNSFSKSTNWDNFNFYANFAYGAGFDMMLANYGPQAHCSNSSQIVGMNGWVAQGQLYAWLQGGIGVTGSIGSQDFDVNILSGTVAALLQGKVPNPSYLYGAMAVQYSILGLINGTYNFDFQVGNDCTIVN